MKLAITLNKDIQCEYICNKIQKLVNDVKQKENIDLSNSMIVIDVVTVTQDDTSIIPKLTHEIL